MNEPVRHLTLAEQKTFHEAWRKSCKLQQTVSLKISRADSERYAEEAGSEYRQLLERVAHPSRDIRG